MEIFYPPPVDKCNLSFKNLAAFTLAEILLSLTVIGIVAAIALPSLLGNANERAWETQKKALYTRFSQALPLLPSLNGYGELVGNLPSTTEDNRIPDDQLKDTATETFVRDGLSKVIKITNICDSEHLSDCGLPDRIIPTTGSNIELSDIKTLGTYNNTFSMYIGPTSSDETFVYEQVDTKAAAFETTNGESILVYYNPNCIPNMGEDVRPYFSQARMCANFVYDLNGKKGPNTVGKDVGFISAIYSTDSVIVAPNLYPNISSSNLLTYNEALDFCREIDEGARLPSLEELHSIFYNKNLIVISDRFWSSNKYSSNRFYTESTWNGLVATHLTTDKKNVRCIKR